MGGFVDGFGGFSRGLRTPSRIRENELLFKHPFLCPLGGLVRPFVLYDFCRQYREFGAGQIIYNYEGAFLYTNIYRGMYSSAEASYDPAWNDYLTFNGVANKLKAPQTLGMNGNDPRTLMVVCRVPASVAGRTFVSHGSGYTTSGNRTHFELSTDPSNNKIRVLTYGDDLTSEVTGDGNIHVVAGVYDGGTNLKLFIDTDVSSYEKTMSGPLGCTGGYWGAGVHNWDLYDSSPDDPFDSDMFLIAYWRKALSTEEYRLARSHLIDTIGGYGYPLAA